MVPAVSWASSGETSSETQPSTPSVRVVDRAEQVGGARAGPRGPASKNSASPDLPRWRRARGSRRRSRRSCLMACVEDRRVRGQPGDRRTRRCSGAACRSSSRPRVMLSSQRLWPASCNCCVAFMGSFPSVCGWVGFSPVPVQPSRRDTVWRSTPNSLSFVSLVSCLSISVCRADPGWSLRGIARQTNRLRVGGRAQQPRQVEPSRSPIRSTVTSAADRPRRAPDRARSVPGAGRPWSAARPRPASRRPGCAILSSTIT